MEIQNPDIRLTELHTTVNIMQTLDPGGSDRSCGNRNYAQTLKNEPDDKASVHPFRSRQVCAKISVIQFCMVGNCEFYPTFAYLKTLVILRPKFSSLFQLLNKADRIKQL